MRKGIVGRRKERPLLGTLGHVETLERVYTVQQPRSGIGSVSDKEPQRVGPEE